MREHSSEPVSRRVEYTSSPATLLSFVLVSLTLLAPVASGRQPQPTDPGRSQTGASVAFKRSAAGKRGVEISAEPTRHVGQTKPAGMEVTAGRTTFGHAIENPNTTDKGAGMLSMEAYLSLEATKDSKWLERAQSAGDFPEGWIHIRKVPRPVDANVAESHWKKEVPTVGLAETTVLKTGAVNRYLDWAVPSYARLYNSAFTASGFPGPQRIICDGIVAMEEYDAALFKRMSMCLPNVPTRTPSGWDSAPPAIQPHPPIRTMEIEVAA